MRNGSQDQKIWLRKLSRAKHSFQKVLGKFWNFWSGWRVFGTKDSALVEFGIFSMIF
jgi:hypothetical protein